MSLISKASELILLYRGMDEPKKALKYDLMLTPQFYIVKDENIPVKYSFQAKRLAPSILEDLLEENLEYEFIVEKIKEGWRFYAYSPKEIEDYLEKLYHIKANQIGKIYFAEQIKNLLLKAPIILDEDNALVLLDSKATIVPTSMLETDNFIEFNPKFKPKKGYKFKSHSSKKTGGSDIDKGTFIAAILIVLIAIAFLIEGISYKKAQKELEDSLISLYEKAPELRSKASREVIKNKYANIEKTQRSIREQLKNFSHLSSKKSVLESLSLNKNKIEANFKVDKKEINRLKSIMANTPLKYKDMGNGILKVEGAIK